MTVILRRKALITGAAGQDAYFLSRRLARHGVHVVGVRRPGLLREQVPVWQLRFFDEMIELDLRDRAGVAGLLPSVKPDLVLNFGAVAGSLTQLDDPVGLLETNTSAVAAFLEAMRLERSRAVFVQASSSEVFAGGKVSPQSLETPRVPRTTYGITKVASDSLVRLYREVHGLSCYSVVLYSHESPLRRPSFFSKRIVAQALDVKEGKSERLLVHSPEAVRDWGYAGEYCAAIVDRMLDGTTGDLVLGSGVGTTVRDFAQLVCEEVGLEYGIVADEAPLQEGRVAEAIAVVADADAPGFYFSNRVRIDVRRLVRLLVRYERASRKRKG